MAQRLKTVWLLTDGKAGDLAQCRGVASYLTDVEIEERVVSPKGVTLLPLPLARLTAQERPSANGSPIAAPFPDLVIATGRRTLPYLKAIRHSEPSTKIAFLKDPGRLGRSLADLIWVPTHDRMPQSDRTVIETHTSPHRFLPDALTELRKSGQTRFPALAQPVTSIFLGGNSKTVTWDAQAITDFALALSKQPINGMVLVTPSRRTPPALLDAAKLALAPHQAWFWEDDSGNPYGEMLALADTIIVTGDSHNMVSEALATGSTLRVYRPPGLKKKLHRFLDTMKSDGLLADLTDEETDVMPRAIDATPEIADAVRRLFIPS